MELLSEIGIPQDNVPAEEIAESIAGRIANIRDAFKACAVHAPAQSALDSPARPPADAGALLALVAGNDSGVYGPRAPIPPTGDSVDDPLTPNPNPIDKELFRPWIVDFTAVLGDGNTWSFEGYVEYDEPTTLTIKFGGALRGHETEVESSGYFSYTTDDVYVDGPTLVTAQAVGDFEGIIDSNIRGIWLS